MSYLRANTHCKAVHLRKKKKIKNLLSWRPENKYLISYRKGILQKKIKFRKIWHLCEIFLAYFVFQLCHSHLIWLSPPEISQKEMPITLQTYRKSFLSVSVALFLNSPRWRAQREAGGCSPTCQHCVVLWQWASVTTASVGAESLCFGREFTCHRVACPCWENKSRASNY